MTDQAPQLSVIVPFHSNLSQLNECLGALNPLPEWAELIVAADGAHESCDELAARHGARVVKVEGPRALGPAVARNRGASAAKGDVLAFIDTDVVAAPGALSSFRARFEERPDVDAVFGAYDENPRETRFMSQYKNLSHSYFHQASKSEARTFWAGLGAIRREAFEAVGGFDERFPRPSVEDIELGYRITARGRQIVLDPSIRGCHLKRWSLGRAIVSDVCDRGIPWTQLLLKFARFDDDLNIQVRQRLAVIFTYALLASLALSGARLAWLAPAALILVALMALNWRYYAFFFRRRGLWFGVRVIPVHVLHHLCNGLSFAAGCALFYATSRRGLTLPGALPTTRWNASAAVRTQP